MRSQWMFDCVNQVESMWEDTARSVARALLLEKSVRVVRKVEQPGRLGVYEVVNRNGIQVLVVVAGPVGAEVHAMFAPAEYIDEVFERVSP